MIYVINGPSASGKTTALEALTEKKLLEQPDAITIGETLEKLVTVTTRPMRPGEVNGIHYHFLTPEEFEVEKARGNMAEETVYAGVKYGILDSEIKRIAAAGKDALVVLDTHGISEMKRFYGTENVRSLFIFRDLKDILAALEARPVPREEVARRFAQAKNEIKNITVTDYVVYNIGTIDDLARNVQDIIYQDRKLRQAA